MNILGALKWLALWHFQDGPYDRNCFADILSIYYFIILNGECVILMTFWFIYLFILHHTESDLH